MSDVLLQKPQAGQVTSIAPQAEDRLVFEFAPGDALLERKDDSLVLSFEDGSAIELVDFYVAYTSENMPEFLIDGEIVPGEAFFAALSEDLMPAAGNTPGAQGSGSNVGLESGSLHGGLDSLGGVDARGGGSSEPTSDFPDSNNVPPDTDDTTPPVPDTTPTLPPTVTINSGADEYVNKVERDADVEVTIGLPVDAVAGDKLNITIINDGVEANQEVVITQDMLDNGNEYKFDIVGATDGDLQVNATVTDVAGNESSAGSDTAIVDTVAKGDVSIDVENTKFSPVINASEESDGILFTGTLSNLEGPVSDLKVTIGGTDYTVENGGLTLSGNDYSVIVPKDALVDGSHTATVTGKVTDIAGNTNDLNDTVDFTLDTTANGSATITVADANASGVVDAFAEVDGIELKGTLSDLDGNLTDLVVTVGGKDYTVGNGLTISGNDYSVIVPKDALVDGVHTATVTGKVTDEYENTHTFTANKEFTLNTASNANVASDDNSLNTEVEVSDLTLPAGFTFKDGATSFDAIVDGQKIGSFEIKDDALVFTQDTAFKHESNKDSFEGTVSLPIADAAGNTMYVDVAVNIGDSGPSIGAVANVAYSDRTTPISGDFDIKMGADDGTDSSVVVTVTIGGNQYNVKVNGESQDLGSMGSIKFDASGEYTFTPKADLVGNVEIKVDVKDADGDSTTQSTVIYDTLPETQIKITTVANVDNTVDTNVTGENLTAIDQLVIAGAVSGTFNPGATITVMVNSTEYTTTVDKDGNFEILADRSSLLEDKDNNITASIVDGGKTYNNEVEVHVDVATVVTVQPGGDTFKIEGEGDTIFTKESLEQYLKDNPEQDLHIENPASQGNNLSNVDFNTGNGNDLIKWDRNADASARPFYSNGNSTLNNIDLGSGTDEIYINSKWDAFYANNGGKNLVDMGTGNDKLAMHTDATSIYSAAASGQHANNTVNMGTGDDVVISRIVVHHDNGDMGNSLLARVEGTGSTSNVVNLDEGNDVLSFSVRNAMRTDFRTSSGDASNVITGGTGDDIISLNGKIIAEQGNGVSQNIIDGDSGNLVNNTQYVSVEDTNDNHDILALTNTVGTDELSNPVANNMSFTGKADDLDMFYDFTTHKQADIKNIEEVRFGWENDGGGWNIVDDATDDYNIDFSQVAANDDGSGLTIMTAAGNDIIKGTQGDDIIYAGDGDDIIFGGSGDTIDAGTGDDLINMSDVIDFNDVLVDGGDGLDVLLVGAKDILSDLTGVSNMEVIIAGDVKGNTTEEVFTELGIATNDKGYIALDQAEWGTGQTNGSYTEFTNSDDITILIETVKLESGNS